MNLYDILQAKYPDANFLKDIILQDNSDGKGAFIKEWNLIAPPPTNEQLQQWAIDSDVLLNYETEQKKLINAPIIVQLQELDLASIRPLRARDNEKLAELEQQAQELRAQLS